MGFARDLARLRPNSSGQLAAAYLADQAVTPAKVSINFPQLVAKVDFTSDFTISGLDGDTDALYLFNLCMTIQTGTDINFGFRPNGDSTTSNYGMYLYQIVERQNTTGTIGVMNETGQANFLRIGRGAFSANASMQASGTIKVKRTNAGSMGGGIVICDYSMSQSNGSAQYSTTIRGTSSYNASANITSLGFLVSGATAAAGTLQLLRAAK